MILNNYYIGITERGDAGLDLSWEKKLKYTVFTIVITKNINDRFIAACLRNKDKIIIHATITGYGGTVLEPNVPKPIWNYNQIKNLINEGFNPKHIVLRIDPVIPTQKGLNRVSKILEMFKDTGITRVRYSIIDMYKHVIYRFNTAGLPIPNINKQQLENFKLLRDRYSNIYTFESCAEIDENQLGCISKKDVDLLGKNITLTGSSYQRGNCKCPGNKLELLTNRHRCPHGCLYCYWKD